LNSVKTTNGKTTKKLLRIVAVILLLLGSIPFVVGGLLLIPSIQKYAVDKAVAFGGSFLNTQVSLDNLYLEPFKTLRLDGFMVYDQKQDTLLYVETLRLDLTSFDREKMSLNIDYVGLKNVYFNLYIAENDTVTNLQFLLDAFASNDEDSSKTALSIACDEVLLDGLRFRFDDANAEYREKGEVDFNHLLVTGLSGRIVDVAFSDSLAANVRGLHLDEQSGFKVRCINTAFSLSEKLIACNDLQLVTNRSVIDGKYAMHYDDFSSFSEFFTEVSLDAWLENSDVNFSDIAYFSHYVNGILTPMKVSGSVYGTLADLRGDIDYLEFARSGFFSGKVRIKGLPDPQAMLINAKADQLAFTATDFEMISIPTGEEAIRIALPSQLHNMGNMVFEGSYVGFISDFVTFGTLKTELGTLETDINIKTGDEKISYSGHLSTKSFQLGRMLESSALGNIALDLDLFGSEFAIDKVKVKAKGRLAQFEALGYNYKNITIDGGIEKQEFEGNLSLNDPNVIIDFTGKVDFKNEFPQVSCVSRITDLKLAPLNLIPTDTFGMVSTMLTLNMKGSSFKNLNGALRLSNLNYANQDAEIHLDSILLADDLIEEGHDIALVTDYAEAHFKGRTNLLDLPYAFVKVGKTYAPEYFSEISLSEVDTSQRFDYRVKIKNDESLMTFIHPDLKVFDPIQVSGKVRAKNDFMDFNVDTISWNLGSMAFKKQTFSAIPHADTLLFTMRADGFSFSGDYFLDNLKLDSRLYNDSLETSVSWFNESTLADSGFFEVLAFTSEEFPVNMILNKLDARIANERWVNSDIARLNADSNRLVIKGLDIRSNVGHITSRGEINPSNNKHLYLDVERFDLSYLTNFGVLSNNVIGLFSGEVDVYHLNSMLVADADVLIDSLIIDAFEIGNIEGNSNYNSEQRALETNLNLNYNGTRNISVVGEYYPFRDEDQLDLDVALKSFRASIIEPFISKYASGLEGEVNGAVAIGGNITSPQITGEIMLTSFSGLVQYLNTQYHIPEAKINIQPDYFGLDYVKVFDQRGDSGSLVASIFHNQFKDFNYDLFFDVEQFQALNTTLAQNEAYYGTAYITGDIGISGYLGQTNIVVDAYTNKGTKLSIPMDDGGDVSDIDYIRFIEPTNKTDEKKVKSDALAEEMQGLNLDFKLSVNDDSELQIIFDEKVGDIIKVNGNGDMLLNIDNKGTFKMYGDYTITGGDYLFTLQNIVNKKFTVQNGSKITWTGDPTDARLDLTAVYDLRASPIALTSSVGDTSDVYKDRTQVNVYLMMKGDLMEPSISFDVDLPNFSESDIVNQLLDPATTSEEVMNQQVFSLLLTNNFFSQGSGVSAFSTTQVTTVEMLTNQFSNYISQYFDKLDVGLNYRPGDETSANQTEVALSTELLNDRVFVQVNGSVQGDNGANQSTSNVAGEFNIEYKINKDGSLRARAFNESNNNNATYLNQAPYTQGLGLFLRKEFDSFGDLFKRKSKDKKEGGK